MRSIKKTLILSLTLSTGVVNAYSVWDQIEKEKAKLKGEFQFSVGEAKIIPQRTMEGKEMANQFALDVFKRIYNDFGKEYTDWYNKQDDVMYVGQYILDDVEENVSDSQDYVQVTMDIFVRGYGNAGLVVRDENGKEVDIKILEGNRPSSTIIGDMKDKFTGVYNAATSEYAFFDSRNTIKKQTITVKIPPGGDILLTKSHDRVAVSNLVDIFFELAGVLGLPESVKADSEYVNILTQAMLQSPLSLLKDSARGKEMKATDVVMEVMKIGMAFLQEAAISKGDELIIGVAKKATTKVISGAVTGAEGIAAVLIATGTLVDYEKSRNNPDREVELTSDLANALADKRKKIEKITEETPSQKQESLRRKRVADEKQESLRRKRVADEKQESLRRKHAAEMRDLTSARTNGSTSHFGSVDYFLSSSNQTDNTQYENHEYRAIATTQENAYYEAGTVVLEAPIDIVLAWGDNPSDLDSHLTGPMNSTGTERFHTYFDNPGNLHSSPNVFLYRDDINHHSGGANLPEQTRINVTETGKYNFYVHDFTNKGSMNSTALSNSGAIVSIHTSGTRNLPEGNNLGNKVAEFSVAENVQGTVWHTFELDTARNTIKPIDEFSNASNPENVPFND